MGRSVAAVVSCESTASSAKDRGGGRKFYLGGVELIKCIDPNEGEALRRGSRGVGRAEIWGGGSKCSLKFLPGWVWEGV